MKTAKMVFIAFTAIFAALSLYVSGQASAASTEEPDGGTTFDDIIEEQGEAAGVPELEASIPDGARELLGDISVTDASDQQGLFQKIIDGTWGKARSAVSTSLRSAAVVILAAMFSGLFAAALPGKHQSYVVLAGVLAIASISLITVNSFIGMGARVLDDLAAFSRLLLPSLTAAATASGAVTSAAIKYSATVLFLDILMTGMRTIVKPLIYAFCAVSIAECAIGGTVLEGVSGLIKWLIRTLLTGFVVTFIIYLSITGVIASSSDAAAVRVTKVMLGTVVPVVGGIIADAADTILSGASVLRGAIGVFGVLIVAATCAIPFLKLGVNYLLFRIAGALSSAVADSRVTKLVNAFGTAFGMILAMTAVSALFLFVSIISAIKVAV